MTEVSETSNVPSFAGAVEIRNVEFNPWLGRILVRGVVLGDPGGYNLEVRSGEHVCELNINRDSFQTTGSRTARAKWSVTISAEGITPRDCAVHLFHENHLIDESVFVAANIEISADAKIVVSDCTISPVSETLTIHGWWAGFVERPSVRIFLHGTQIGVPTTGRTRKDVAAKYPALGRSDLGWAFTGKVAGLAGEIFDLEIVLYDGRNVIASVKKTLEPHKGARDQRIERLLRARIAEKIATANDTRLDRLVRSRSLARFCNRSGLNGRLANHARNLIIDRSLANQSIKSRFNTIYEANIWGSDLSASGPGSELEFCFGIIAGLPEICKKFGVKTLIDAPCGDLHWIKPIIPQLGIAHYIGIDISDSLISKLNMELSERYDETDNVELTLLAADLADDELPDADMILIKDLLQHLSHARIRKLLINLSDSKIKYIVISNYYQQRNSDDIDDGGARYIDLMSSPYNAPEPLMRIEEKIEEPARWRRWYGVWSKEQILELVANL